MGLAGGLLGAAAIGGSIFSGVQQSSAARKSLNQQKRVQQSSLARAISEQRRSELEQRKLNRRKPDLAALFAGELASTNRGVPSSLSTGGGVTGNTLGSRSVLGV